MMKYVQKKGMRTEIHKDLVDTFEEFTVKGYRYYTRKC